MLRASAVCTLVIAPPPFDWVGIISTGQSLAVGATSEAITTSQPYGNLMLLDSGAVYPVDGSPASWSAVPLVEPHRMNVSGTFSTNFDYPHNICRLVSDTGPGGETPHSGMGNSISKAWNDRTGGAYVTAHTAVGVGGFALIYLNQGTPSFDAALSETAVYKALSITAGKTYGVGAVLLTHGESDTTLATSDYGAQVHDLWSDYNTDIKAITGQVSDIVLLASQQSSVKGGGHDSVSIQLWRAGRDYPGEVVCTGPKYGYSYAADGVHMPAGSYARLGEKSGEVFDLIVNQGAAWKPLGPNAASRVGNVITVDFDVPNAPLAWDAHLPAPHQASNTAWANGKGFEVTDAGGQVSITSAAIVGSSVVLTLGSTPSGTVSVAYAATADDGGNYGGRGVDLMGLLRDSDAFEGSSIETISVSATNGSNTLTASAGAFVRRAKYDIVTGAGLASDTAVTAISSTTLTLSANWTGSTGTHNVTVQHNHRNYCVQFALELPWP